MSTGPVSSSKCSTCGLPVPPDAPAGQCPNCLLGLAIAAETDWEPGPVSKAENKERRFGDYVLGRQVGAGGMGVVYEAHQVSLERKVAIKLLRDAHGASPVLLCRFTIETEAAARLNHPNIVRVYEVGECNGHPYFSMDFISGQPLGTRISQGQFPFDWKTGPRSLVETRRRLEAITRLMIKIARAVQHAHEKGVLHRDLKPGNILLDAQDEPHLTDFGLAKILHPEQPHPNLTTLANLPGTPNYMAPEQVLGEEATRASDVYGLGAIFYELLTGRAPFSGPTPLEVFRQITDQEPARPRRLNPAIAPGLETICLKCLEKNLRHRFISAEALAQDLENWLADRPIKARPSSLAYRVKRWTQRNPIGTALIISLCLGLSASLVLLKIVTDQREQIELDRDQTFEEGMNKIALLWQDKSKTQVSISARELAILAGHSPINLARAEVNLTLGVGTAASPSTAAQWYAHLLGELQEKMQKELGHSVAFNLKLFKRFNNDKLSLANGEADLMILSAGDYLKAKTMSPGITPIGREKTIREAVIFVHTNAGVSRLPDLAGKSIAFPDPDLSISIWAKAHLAAAGLQASSFAFFTNIVDQGAESGTAVASLQESVYSVLRKEVAAGVTYRDRFEHTRFNGLLMLARFQETPNVLAARQDLDPRVIAAVRQVLHLLKGKPGYDDVSLGLPGAMVVVDDSYFAPLKNALRDAEQFEAGAGLREKP